MLYQMLFLKLSMKKNFIHLHLSQFLLKFIYFLFQIMHQLFYLDHILKS